MMKLDQIGTYLQPIQAGGKLCVITDTNVAPLYLHRCRGSLISSGYEVYEYILDAGESSKNGTNYLRILEYLASVPFTRSDGIVALGGGMVGDISGFVAATYMRGIRVVQVPTTLLAAVDSSVGGKTAIDLPAGKNLVGAFHQPELVLQDRELLRTLPPEVYREGMAEVIKYGAIEDAAFLNQLSDPEWTKAHLDDVIRKCVDIKKAYVEKDEFDRGLRHMLNFGHTLGHAIEKVSGYAIRHGDAVAKGMYWITRISVKEGWCEEDTLDCLKDVLDACQFDLTLPQNIDAIYQAICSDKKRTNDRIHLITLDRIGQGRIRNMTMEEVRSLL